MSLAWNTVHRNGLASGSADNTVKLWDLNTGACAATLAHCDDKVQAVRWHPTEGACRFSVFYESSLRPNVDV
jgi:periodic tryptophan protein 1